ncbi:hypothetical protein ACN0IV_08940 [Trabulsiella odontotermitis]
MTIQEIGNCLTMEQQDFKNLIAKATDNTAGASPKTQASASSNGATGWLA